MRPESVLKKTIELQFCVSREKWENDSDLRSSWDTPLNPALERQRPETLYEFEDSLIYIISSRRVKTTLRDPVSKK